MEMDCQFISIYGKFLTSQTVSFSRADIISWTFYLVLHVVTNGVPTERNTLGQIGGCCTVVAFN